MKEIVEKKTSFKLSDFEQFGLDKIKKILVLFSNDSIVLEEITPGNILVGLKDKKYKIQQKRKKKKKKK